MTTREEREVLLQGQDPIANLLISCLLREGWQVDRILKNSLSKEYLPHTAVIRVELDSENRMYQLNGEYTSEGRNVLAGYSAYIKADLSLAATVEAMASFIEGTERGINESFAVRFLSTPTVCIPELVI